MDDILDKVRSSKGRILLSKIDIARALRNLCVDPVDAFKFGIQWRDQYFLDIMVAFGWVHGMAAFQMSSDAILYIMKQETCALFVHQYGLPRG